MAATEKNPAKPAKKAERHRKTRIGFVISDKMDKTIVVEVARRVKHALYGKFLKRRVRYKAHDQENACKVGDQVLIEETRPMSRHKRWRVKSTLKKALTV
jgi:small subunit ribosomal protein S17